MPFVRIDALGADPERLDALGRAVHQALQETIGIPADDHFQVLTGHDGVSGTLRYGGYLGVHRDEGIVYVSVTLRAGRPAGRKRALYRRIAELAHAYAGTEPRNVFVVLTENASVDWSLGHGLAQYDPEPGARAGRPPHLPDTAGPSDSSGVSDGSRTRRESSDTP
nr:tautomerase family protein [Kitasatospora sp. Xyl93]